MSEAIQARMYLFRIHLALSEIFVSRRRYKPALIHYRLFHEIQKGFSKEETDISIHRLQVQSEIEKYQKESEIERLRKVELKGKSEELEASLAKLRLIDTVLKKTATSGDMEELAAAIYKGLRTQMDAEVLSILIYHEGKRELDYRISIKGSVHLPSIKESMSQQNSLGVQCVSKRKEIILQHASQEHGRHPSPLSQPFGFVAESVIYLPLISGKRTAGALTVQSSRINAYQNEHLDLLKALAPVTVLALKIFHLSGRD